MSCISLSQYVNERGNYKPNGHSTLLCNKYIYSALAKTNKLFAATWDSMQWSQTDIKPLVLHNNITNDKAYYNKALINKKSCINNNNNAYSCGKQTTVNDLINKIQDNSNNVIAEYKIDIKYNNQYNVVLSNNSANSMLISKLINEYKTINSKKDKFAYNIDYKMYINKEIQKGNVYELYNYNNIQLIPQENIYYIDNIGNNKLNKQINKYKTNDTVISYKNTALNIKNVNKGLYNVKLLDTKKVIKKPKPKRQSINELIKQAESKQNIPSGLLRAIGLVESRLQPYAINYNGRGYFFKTKAEALKFVNDLIRKGETNFGVGCFQLHYKSHFNKFRSVNEMLDPARNVKYAASLLKHLYKYYNYQWSNAVRRYHSGDSYLNGIYYNKVMRKFGRFI